MTMKITY